MYWVALFLVLINSIYLCFAQCKKVFITRLSSFGGMSKYIFQIGDFFKTICILHIMPFGRIMCQLLQSMLLSNNQVVSELKIDPSFALLKSQVRM